ncbi:restriction endonuclease subunit S [Coprococcus sp. AF16-22]|uniref:restriction endonuclease subunit S n=1 Tax=Coprococcus sp. AF16-22 TaxID=2293087 RepID=UPI000E4DD26D|nr:restriction endonuclease subunit S [Coprococcus sp. AF16-22]RGH00595.1 restriction endonuclease subunit S [Coprococcus sp. AF16-22]
MKLKLEDVCERGSSSLKQSDILGMTGDYPIYGASGYIGNVDFYHQEKPYVAIVKDGAGIGRTTFHTAKSSVIGTMQYLLPKDNVLPKYLYYVVGHMHLEKYFSGATIPHIYFKDYKSEEFNYDSLDKQKNIVEILGRCEKVISARKRELELLDSLIKARFVEMFENEIEYNKVKLEEIADIVSGITKGRKTKCGELREVPYMAVSNVKDGYIDWTTVKTILATEDEIIQYKLLPDDVLMTEGGDPDKLGRGAIISLPPKDCIHQNHIFRVRLDETQILPRYFAAYLQSSQAKTYFLRAAKQTTGIASINMSQLRGLPTIVPPIELQLKYSLFSEQVDKSKLLSLIKLLEQLITYLYNVFIIYRQDKGEEVEKYE